ncbi:hypothetical protein L2E82_49087 [Cichorium intybus]|uniref:Uncharacterized protein n=1 Tax=Cichorium intybus TaxID=13427 RepID=A0ACB8YZH2_CICIN|nr:hypothetical protein L2E82_49087 [Cichorium intybus]
MAFSLQISYIRVLFLAFLTISFPLPGKGDLIDDVCSEMPDKKPLCLDTLRTDPRSTTQNLEVLAQISIDACVKDATGLPSFVESLGNKVSDPRVKTRISGCVINAENALGGITHAKQLVGTRFYGAAKENARTANDTLSICEHTFLIPSAVEPVELKQAMDRLESLVSIFIVITNRLS